MPLVLDRRLAHGLAASTGHPIAFRRGDAVDPPSAGTVEVGLLNNMPDAALRATERQFIELLGVAAGPLTVRLRLFSLATLPREGACRAHLARAYGSLEDLTRTRLDALIVTGSEPKAASLTEEPYWAELAAVIDWAEHNTRSTIWSCLAAHAAVLHLDGIARHRLPEKRFGLYECAKLAEHPLLDATPPVLRIPHSRWNDLREGELRAHGYRVLTRSPEVGVDIFTKQWRSTFYFFQGHPEYQPEAILREYGREIKRFRDGTRTTPPAVPAHCFDARTAAHLEAAVETPNTTLSGALANVAFRPGLTQVWRDSATRLYANWLRSVATHDVA